MRMCTLLSRFWFMSWEDYPRRVWFVKTPYAWKINNMRPLSPSMIFYTSELSRTLVEGLHRWAIPDAIGDIGEELV